MKTPNYLSFLLCALLLTLPVAENCLAEVKIGVLAKRGAAKAIQQWGPTAQFLSAELGEKVVIIPLKFTAIAPMVNGKRIDFLLANSAIYVEMEKKYQLKAVATMINSRGGKSLEKFGGVILVKGDSAIKSLADIRGTKLMVVKYSSFGGGQMAWRLLVDNNIDPQRDTAVFLEGNNHDNVVLAVHRGLVDVGSVRSDTMERMEAEGKIDMSNFRILHQIEDAFPFVHSTRLYPEWPMAAVAGTNADLISRVTAALTSISADSPAAQAAQIVGWKEPADYSSVRECLSVIKHGAFSNE